MPPVETQSPENEELKRALESLLFITDHPLDIEQLCRITGVKDPQRVSELVAEIARDLGRGALQLMEVAGGFQMATRPAYAPYVRRLFADRMTMRLSTAALETLSIIAYKQPITRAEIEEIRGVEVIAALETLLEKRLIRVVGRKESVGRPLMYGTSMDFLRQFGLRGLSELPPLEAALAPAGEGPAPEAPGPAEASRPPGGAPDGAQPEGAPETPAPQTAAEGEEEAAAK